jgi:hypothetical protein
MKKSLKVKSEFFKITLPRVKKLSPRVFLLSAKNFFTGVVFFAENYFFTLGEELFSAKKYCSQRRLRSRSG